LIYLDNAATSWPKPESVYRAVDQTLRFAANPGRGEHRLSRESARLVLQSREAVAGFFGVQDSRHIIFTSGATESINMVIYGLPGLRRVLSVGYEHNSLWRPLEDVARTKNVVVQYITPLGPEGFDWNAYEEALACSPDLVTVTHASNVTGQVHPLAEIAQMARAAGALVLADLSQTAGILELNLAEIEVDFAAFPGHKGLLGPQGIGGLYIRDGSVLRPGRLGGTGGNSASPYMPEQLPDKFEGGTLNVPGIAGLAAGVSFLQQKTLRRVHAHELALRQRLKDGLEALGAVIFGGEGPSVGVLSFNLPGIDSRELAFILDDQYSICVRGGLHCSPRSHQALGTTGAVRVSPGIFNTGEEIDTLLSALEQIKQAAE